MAVTTSSGRPSATSGPSAPSPHGSGRAGGLLARLESPVAAYYLVLGSTVALAVVGLVMVLSSSSVESLRTTGNSYAVFTRQAVWAALAVPLMAAAVHTPVRVWKGLAWPMLALSLGALALVFSSLGVEEGGNRNWVAIGGMTLQPSEGAKFALVVWAAAVLARKRALLDSTMHALVPVVIPVAALMLALVLAGHDVGTALVLLVLLGALLWVAGAPLRLFVVGGALAAAGVAAVVQTRATRVQRIQDWLGGECQDTDKLFGSCWQSIHGTWALASGGWWGVGLGGSREKWSWLPEAHNDFIFAIIGEELGLAGTLVVLALFATLGVGLYLVVLRSDDAFVKIATGGVLAWVLGQAVINLGAVLGMLPVIGVPLPLVSSGGSALVTTLVALGMVIGFARNAPGAREALSARAGVVARSLAVVPGARTLRRSTTGTGTASGASSPRATSPRSPTRGRRGGVR